LLNFELQAIKSPNILRMKAVHIVLLEYHQQKKMAEYKQVLLLLQL